MKRLLHSLIALCLLLVLYPVTVSAESQTEMTSDSDGEDHTHDYSSTVVDPTCTNVGYTLHTCSICGGSYQDSFVDALEHDLAPATCIAPISCKREGCDYTLGIVTSHTWKNNGSGVMICSVCGEHQHHFSIQIVSATCLTEGYTVFTCRYCDLTAMDNYKAPLGHSMSKATCTLPKTCARSGCSYTEGEPLGHVWDDPTAKIKFCTVCDEREGGYVVPLYQIYEYQTYHADAAWVDGVEYKLYGNIYYQYLILEELKPCMVTVCSYNKPGAKDLHEQYPTRLRVVRLGASEKGYGVEDMRLFENILKYSGTSIRITGTKGIRMITSMPRELKKWLTSDYRVINYSLVEYGTVLAWASDLEGGKPLTLGQPYAKSNYAYKRGVADPIYKKLDEVIQYTNVLVGFTNDQCKDDIAMRPYAILEKRDGTQYTIYGAIVYRSIGYIAYQNRNAFKVGSEAYEYVWDIIHHVYGDQYDAEYQQG